MAPSRVDILLSQCSTSFNGLFLFDEFGGLGSFGRSLSLSCCHHLFEERGDIVFVVLVSRKRPIAWTDAAHVGSGETHKWRKKKKNVDCKDRLVFRNCDAKNQSYCSNNSEPTICWLSFLSFPFSSLSACLCLRPSLSPCDSDIRLVMFDMTSSEILQWRWRSLSYSSLSPKDRWKAFVPSLSRGN